MFSKKSPFLRRAAWSLGPILALALGLCDSGCGTPTTPTSPTPAPPPPPVRTVLLSTTFNSLPPHFVSFSTFQTPATGTLDATVDWTFAADAISVFIGPGGVCTLAQLNAGTCAFIASSQTTTPKPRVLTVPSAAAGTYTIYVFNGGPNTESGTVQVGLTTSTASAGVAGRAGVPGAPPALTGVAGLLDMR
jgi:hypothetical protein